MVANKGLTFIRLKQRGKIQIEHRFTAQKMLTRRSNTNL